MPEVLTKHPDIVIKVLRSEGAQCATGATPKILTKCPSDKFCTLAGGELCVYGSGELASMTQLSPTELCKSSTGATSSREVVPVPPSSQRDDHLVLAAVPVAIAIVAVGIIGRARRSRAGTAS